MTWLDVMLGCPLLVTSRQEWWPCTCESWRSHRSTQWAQRAADGIATNVVVATNFCVWVLERAWDKKMYNASHPKEILHLRRHTSSPTDDWFCLRLSKLVRWKVETTISDWIGVNERCLWTIEVCHMRLPHHKGRFMIVKWSWRATVCRY